MNKLKWLCLMCVWGVVGCQSTTEMKTVTIFSASSLTDLFTEYEDQFEQIYPDVDVVVAYAGSQQLRTQLELGATADLFFPAHPDYLLTDNPLLFFARNQLLLVVHPSLSVTTYDELLNGEYTLGIGVDAVPIGRYSRQWIEQLGIAEPYLDQVVTQEISVRQLRAKIGLGAIDGGIIYQTDLNAEMRALDGIPPFEGEILYPIESLSDSVEAEQFIQFILSAEGQAILTNHQFLPIR